MKEIIIDQREPEEMERYFETLTSLTPVRIQITEKTPYPTGDYCSGEIMFERKTVTDFDSSVLDDSIFEQCQKMRIWMNENPKRIARLYIIGRLGHYNEYAKISFEQRIGAIESISSRYGIQIITMDDEIQMVIAIQKVIKSWHENKIGVGRPFKFTKAKDITLLEHTLGGIGGIGKDTVGKIMNGISATKIFKFCNDIVDNEGMLVDIKHIGPTTAKKIKEELGING